MHIVPRFFVPPAQSFFLLGPRGTGKSTLLNERFPAALWIDLLKPDVYREYAAYPERLFDVLKGNPDCRTVVIDEIQKLPTLLSVVHALIEEKRGYQFVLTGSSARKLKQAGTNLLGGRALNCTLHPFMAAEIGADFALPRALEQGLLPLIFNAAHPAESLQAYISLYLQQEVQSEGIIRQLENFARFLTVISFSHASLLNTTNVARECAVKRKTVENYIKVLEDLLLAYQLPVFSRHAQRALISHNKFYLFDAGVFKALRPVGPLDRPEEMQGAALEGLVAQHLRAWCQYSQQKHELFFWRTRAGVEVDFVVYGPQGLWAIEVKNSQRVYAQDTKPLNIFLQDYPMAQTILLYRGSERLQFGKVLCLPCEQFLSGLKPGQPLF